MPNSDPQTGQHCKWRSGSGLAADSSFKGPWDPEMLKPNTFVLAPASGAFACCVQKHLWKLPIHELDASSQLHLVISKAGEAAATGAAQLLEQVRQDTIRCRSLSLAGSRASSCGRLRKAWGNCWGLGLRNSELNKVAAAADPGATLQARRSPPLNLYRIASLSKPGPGDARKMGNTRC